MAEDWKKQLELRSDEIVTHTVRGKELRFYPVSVRALPVTRVLAPAFRSIALLLEPVQDRAHTSSTRELRSPDGGVAGREQTDTITPTTAELLKARAALRDKAIETLVETLLEAKNLKLWATLVLDSLRDLAPRKPSDADLESFLDADLPTLLGYLQGVALANVSVFGPFGARLKKVLAEVTGRALSAEDATASKETTNQT